MRHRLFLLTLLSVITSMQLLKATTIGSDTAVTLISTMATLNNGDMVTGFTSLQGGFFITDSTVTATWNALFPVSGSVLFNGGALYLQRDLDFTSDTLLSLPGTIVGNGYTMNIVPTITAFADGCVPVLKTTQPTGNVNGGLYYAPPVGWSYDDLFVAVARSPSVSNYRFNGTNMQLVGTSSVNVRTLAWHPLAYYLATFGSGLQIFSVNGTTGALTQVSSVGGTFFSGSWHPTGDYLIASSSSVILYPVSSTGILGGALTISPSITGVVSTDWAPTGSYVALGTNPGTVTVYQFDPLAGSALTQKASSGGLGAVYSIAWNPVYQDIIAIGQGGPGPSYDDPVRVYRFNASVNTLTQIASISGSLVNSASVDWSNDGACLMIGMTPTNPLTVYSFNVTTTTLTLVANSAFTTSSVGAPAVYSPVNNYIAQFYRPTSAPGQLRIYVPTNVTTFSDVTMAINNDLSLHYYYLALSGDCSILGNGNTLSLQETSTLAIAANSTLTLRNLNLTGLMPQAIQMADSSSKLILDNVTITLDGNTTFTQGTLKIEADVEVVGQGAFMYSSTMPCAIDRLSTLLFDNDTTFSFVPASSSRNLLQFADSTSRLFLNGASLVTTQTGIDLTKGTLVINRHATIASDATVAGEGIAFGDGANIANNMNVQLYPAATLEVVKGIVVDNNV